MKKPVVICLTPVKNEAWILDRFLKSASLWADHIIIADQMSTDGSRDICKKYEKVILIENNSEMFNEPERQKLLIDEARKIEGTRLLLTLDADELFSPNYDSPEWSTMLNATPGTVLEFQRANLLSDLQNMWMDSFFPWGYMDDGHEHEGKIIHSARIPTPRQNDRIRMTDIKVLHFQFTDMQRMKQKHYWYQCFESINKINNPIDIFRIYHHMYAIDKSTLIPVPQKWIEGYANLNIDITSIHQQNMLYWEKQILDYMNDYGVNYFKHLNIWDMDWVTVAEKWGYSNPEKYKDPRKKWEKAVNKWLLKTQTGKRRFLMMKIDTILKKIYK
jgi:glycosyltransferase involved in cell wall biosynthesis